MERPHCHCSHIPARLGRWPLSDGLGRCRQGLDYSPAESLETQLGGKFRDQVGLGAKQRVPLDPAGEMTGSVTGRIADELADRRGFHGASAITVRRDAATLQAALCREFERIERHFMSGRSEHLASGK